jgi:hypothetical protein
MEKLNLIGNTFGALLFIRTIILYFLGGKVRITFFNFVSISLFLYLLSNFFPTISIHIFKFYLSLFYLKSPKIGKMQS